MNKKQKYSIDDLKNFPDKARLVKIGLMIANELHNIHSALKTKEIKKIRCRDCKKTYLIHNEESCVFCDSKNLEFLSNQ